MQRPSRPLLAEDKAYPCFCTTEEREADRAEHPEMSGYSGRCAGLSESEREARRAEGREAVIRFRIGEGSVEFDDLVRGRVSIDTSQLGGDLVIARSDGSPLYHFVVVVDDIAMRISHVIRGEDHLSNTPKHVLLFRALGAEPPVFAHLPLILNPDRSKMSKRKSQTAVDAYREQGYIPEAIVNHLALLGWSSGDDEEIFSPGRPRGALRPLARAAVRRHLRRRAARLAQRPMDPPPVAGRPGRRGHCPSWCARCARPRRTATPCASRPPLMSPRCCRWSWSACRASTPSARCSTSSSSRISRSTLRCWCPSAGTRRPPSVGLADALRLIEEGGEDGFAAEELEPALRLLCEQHGWKVGDLFMAIRVAITGRTATPPLFDVMVALGYETTLDRLASATELAATIAGEE